MRSVQPKKNKPLWQIPRARSTQRAKQTERVTRRTKTERPKLAWLLRPKPREPLFARGDSEAAMLGAAPIKKKSGNRSLQRTQQRKFISNQCYFKQACRPIASLYFLLPLIIFYEVAKIFMGQSVAYSGIDYWVCEVMQWFQAGQLVILPTLTTAVLLVWHHRQSDRHGVRPQVIATMAAEALAIGLTLFLVANAFLVVFSGAPDAGRVADPYYWTIGSADWWAHVVTYVGTGIHEELIFRVLIMLPLIVLLTGKMKTRLQATVIAACISSLMFASAHVDWFNPAGEPFHEVKFLFRFAAACFFSAVFHYRGFGIAVGTHIIYNVLTLLSR